LSNAPATDSRLASDLEDLASDEKWAFHSWTEREYSHGLFQYPAMMVPQMQRELLERLKAEFNAQSAYDPFVGSGTSMAESMLQGLDFVGADINPLAVLLCRAKAGPFYIDALDDAAGRIMDRAKHDKGLSIEAKFQGWQKWFRKDVAISLSRLRRAIRREALLSTRRFMWVALAETVRLCSNSRTSTVKLHIRPADEVKERTIDVLGTFSAILHVNLDRFADQRDALNEAGLLNRGHYSGQVVIALHDVSAPMPADQQHGPCDVLLTSPPYGDNNTTVTYGQHSFLPLQWIDLEDIDPSADDSFLASTHAIDSRSLGAPTAGAVDQVAVLRAKSSSLDRILEDLSCQPPDRAARVAAFWRDMDASLEQIAKSMSKQALMAWTVGNRCVGGREISMDSILKELLSDRGWKLITQLSRAIPECRKRMASRNSISRTMNSEKVLVLHRAAV
jgi:hypothetical protein